MNRIVLSHRLHEDGMELLQAAARVSILDKSTLAISDEDIEGQDGIIIRLGTLDGDTIRRAERLKVIGRSGVGVDNIDVAAATASGIPIVVTPNANTLSVAEHTLTLMLILAKDIPFCESELRQGRFDARNRYRSFEIQGKRVGLIGFGHIGKEVARLCNALAMKVCIYDPLIPQSEVKASGHEVSLDLRDLLKTSDFVSLHVPLTEQTRNLIGEQEIKLMKDGAFLVNCSRGGIVDETALCSAVENGKLGGAGLDVFSSERPHKNDRLLNLNNVVVTPHMAAQTREAASKMARMVSQGVLAVIAGEKWPHVANPEAFDNQRWKA